jgi:hypothetical protein
MPAPLYEADFYAWAMEQAELLRSGQVDQADLAEIADEIESLGKAEKRELVSRMTDLLLHLLKWAHQPTRRGNSWRLAIANARDETIDVLTSNPSLKAQLDAPMAKAYRYARRRAVIETDLPEPTFPTVCPWSFETAIDENFWP